jgi:hypothetical protein
MQKVLLEDCCSKTLVQPEAKKKSVVQLLGAKVYPAWSREEKLSLDTLFANAIHATCTPFNCFQHPSWQQVFALAIPDWNLPAPELDS